MKLNELAPAFGAKKAKKRVGRGPGGTDKTSGRGHKGQQSRSGSSNPAGGSYKSEGGQTPLIRKLPKRGFNHVGQEFHIINLDDLLARFEAGATVNDETLVQSGLLRKVRYPVKLLGRGNAPERLTVTLHSASQAAIEKVKAAGGTITVAGVEPTGSEVA